MGGFSWGGGTRPGPPYFYLYKIFLEPYIFPHYTNTCLKILKCLLYVWATVKIQFANTILNHTHLLLGRNASLHVRPPPQGSNFKFELDRQMQPVKMPLTGSQKI